MKKRTIFFPALLVAFGLSGAVASAQSRDHSWWGGQSLETVEPDASFALETKGWNTRVYEWTPKTAPHMTCTAQFADAGPVGMQCFPKEVREDG